MNRWRDGIRDQVSGIRHQAAHLIPDFLIADAW
jgi:hypothetical protein